MESLHHFKQSISKSRLKENELQALNDSVSTKAMGKKGVGISAIVAMVKKIPVVVFDHSYLLKVLGNSS
jgi:hypothetical protein